MLTLHYLHTQTLTEIHLVLFCAEFGTHSLVRVCCPRYKMFKMRNVFAHSGERSGEHFFLTYRAIMSTGEV